MLTPHNNRSSSFTLKKVQKLINIFKVSILVGFHTLIDELGGYYSTKSRLRLHQTMQDMLPVSLVKRDNDGPDPKKYRQYKKDYVKQLTFDAQKENMSENILLRYCLTFPQPPPCH